jgi:hypothetical protein
MASHASISTSNSATSGSVQFLNVSYSLFQEMTNQSGGAIYIIGPLFELRVCYCIFVTCRATSYGGAIRTLTVHQVHLFGFSGIECVSDGQSSACDLHVTGASSGIELAESVFFKGSADYGTNFLNFGSRDPTVFAVAESLNFTENRADAYGSAMWINPRYSLSMRFCFFDRNAPASVLRLDVSTQNDTFSCLSLQGNSATDGTTYQGQTLKVSFICSVSAHFATRFLSRMNGPIWSVPVRLFISSHFRIAFSIKRTFRRAALG